MDDLFIQDLSEFFKVFADPTRLKILISLNEKEKSVQELASSINLSQSATSHQLQTLKQNRLVKFRREGTTLFYSLDDDHILSILSLASTHLKEK